MAPWLRRSCGSLLRPELAESRSLVLVVAAFFAIDALAEDVAVGVGANATIVFDPSSRMVTYKDVGGCGPRGANAKAELLRACEAGYHLKEHAVGADPVATVAGCDYTEYTVYACNPVPDVPPFDPKSPLVSYQDVGTCGPRGEDANADLSVCAYGAVLATLSNEAVTINFCEYKNYTVYTCSLPPEASLFFPASPLVSYEDIGACGPRSTAENGGDVKADTSSCTGGSRVVKQRQATINESVAIIAGCKYAAYTVFECLYYETPPFDPASPLVSYSDVGACGPRGADAKADIRHSCRAGAHVSRQVPNNKRSVVATINGCDYYAYTVFECNPVPEVPAFDPTSALVAYGDIGGCGPRGAKAEADLRQCPKLAAHVVKDVPDIAGKVVTTIDYCGYSRYRVYACNDIAERPKFDPNSTHVSYRDLSECGPRGTDARADTSDCANGAEVVEHRGYVLHQKDVVATINGCQYYEYTVYRCKGNCPKHYYDCDTYCSWRSDCAKDCECTEKECPQGCVAWRTASDGDEDAGAGAHWVPSIVSMSMLCLAIIGCLSLKAVLNSKPIGAPLLDDAEEMAAVQFTQVGQTRQIQSAHFSQF